MEYKTHSIPENLIRSVNKLSFKSLILARLIVAFTEFDSSVIAERLAQSPFNVSLNPFSLSRNIAVSIGLDHRSALRSKLDRPSMFNSIVCYSLDRSIPSLKH